MDLGSLLQTVLELNRIKAMSDLSTEALVATAGADNAALLADLKKHEATEGTNTAQANAQAPASSRWGRPHACPCAKHEGGVPQSHRGCVGAR